MARVIRFDMIGEVMRLKKEKLSFRQIAKRLNSDVKTVYRWYLMGVGLSTGKTRQGVGK